MFAVKFTAFNFKFKHGLLFYDCLLRTFNIPIFSDVTLTPVIVKGFLHRNRDPLYDFSYLTPLASLIGSLKNTRRFIADV